MSGPPYFPCLLMQNLLHKLIVDTKRYHCHQFEFAPIDVDFKTCLQSNVTVPTLALTPNNVMQVLPLHQYPEFTQQCCRLINDEWKRSETARMRSLESSCDTLPTNLILLHENNVIGHSKLSVIPSVLDSCYLESVVIDKELRGKGFGKYLMQRVEQHCRGLGLKTIFLSTKDKVDFYAKLGYAICEPVSIYGEYVKSMSESRRPVADTKQINNRSIKMVDSSLPPPSPPPLPPDLYVGTNCSKKVFMSKVLD